MIELSNTNAQVLAAGQSMVFDIVLLHTGCGECHRPNTGSVFLAQKKAIYEVSFNANIGGTAAGDAQLAITLDATPLPETTSKVVTTTAGDLQNVSASSYVKTCCCNAANSILLTNTGTTEINVDASARLSVRRVA